MAALKPFLTAWDPSDLPGGSVDPLGFDRSYQFLADKLLPGLTNVAGRPRYFSALCAAVRMSEDNENAGEPPRVRRERRVQLILRFERFWALASVLASRNLDEVENGGIRGVRYVERAIARLEEKAATQTDADFRLLSRQQSYGMLGVYGTVADNLRLLGKDTMGLTHDPGRMLGEAFLQETAFPASMQRAIIRGETVPLKSLLSWGEVAHPDASAGVIETRKLMEALTFNDTRKRMAELLREHILHEGETEIHRLGRIHRVLAAGVDHPDLREALRAIVAFEEACCWLLMGFHRLLWFCQSEAPFAMELDAAGKDRSFIALHQKMPGLRENLQASLIGANTVAFTEGLQRMTDFAGFIDRAAACGSVASLVECILMRHREVQRGKMQGGKPKMPWLEIVNGKVVPTLASAQRIGRPPESGDDVGAHPYRTGAVDRFLRLEALA